MLAKLASHGPGLLRVDSRRTSNLVRGVQRRGQLKYSPLSPSWPARGATLDLDFVNNRGYLFGRGQNSSTAEIISVRSTTATYWNSQGVLSTAAENVLRLDYDPLTLVCRGLLMEDARTNTFLRSEELDDAAWTVSGVTVTSNAGVAPDGATTADRMVPSASVVEHNETQAIGTIVLASLWTMSAFAKRDIGERYLRLAMSNDIFSGGSAYFDLDTGTVSNIGSGASASMVPLQNGWWRCILTAPCTIEGAASGAIYSYQEIGIDFAGDGSSGPLIWGLQAELGAYATSYIPTTTATVARSKDSANIYQLAQLLNMGSGTLSVKARPISFVISEYTAALGDMTATNYLAMGVNPLSNGVALVIMVANSVMQLVITGAAVLAGVEFSEIITYRRNGTRFASSGFLSLQDTDCNIPKMTTLNIGSSSGVGTFSGHIPRLQYFPFCFSDAEMKAATI